MDWLLKDVKELLLIFHGIAVMKDSIFIFRRCMPPKNQEVCGSSGLHPLTPR